jgi:hypothetical protein
MKDSPKILASPPPMQKSSGASLPQVSADKHLLEIESDVVPRMLPDDNIVGVKKFTPSSEKILEQPQEIERTYCRLTPRESLEKIKAACRLKSTKLRFRFYKG